MDTVGHDARTPAAYTRIVVGIDGSGSSIRALRHAVIIAQKFGAQVSAICVWNYPIAFTPLPAHWHPDHDARHSASRAAEAVFGDGWPSWFSVSIRKGSPALTLVDESATADLLVVGNGRYGRVTGVLLGSVSSHCAAHSRCPVMIVHDSSREHAQDAGGGSASRA